MLNKGFGINYQDHQAILDEMHKRIIDRTDTI